jgi:hypothetical protein
LSLFSAALLHASFVGRGGCGSDSKEREAAARVARLREGEEEESELREGAMM